jgi:xanthine/CO dehydrogenase XdhC/CoxF family maturation factor
MIRRLTLSDCDLRNEDMSITDAEILAKAEEWKRSGRKVALATVVETWGSAPREAGAHLVIDADGNFFGSVSGGCVEGDVVAESSEIIESGVARVLEFGVADETAWRAGLSCGGRIRVYVERIDD